AYVVTPDIFNPKRSGPAGEFDAQLKQPDIFGSKITAQALVGYDVGIQEGYKFHGPRTQLGIDRPFFDERVVGGVSWNLQYLNFFDIDQSFMSSPFTSQLGYDFVNPYRLAYLEEFAQLDLRDNALNTHDGGFVMVRTEQGLSAVGSDFTYLKITPEVRVFYSPVHRITLAARGLAGWLQ